LLVLTLQDRCLIEEKKWCLEKNCRKLEAELVKRKKTNILSAG